MSLHAYFSPLSVLHSNAPLNRPEKFSKITNDLDTCFACPYGQKLQRQLDDTTTAHLSFTCFITF